MARLERTIAFVAVSDLAQAEEFYGETLGITLRDEWPFAVVGEIGGTEIRIAQVDEVIVAPYTVLGWAVPDIEAAVDELAGRGVTFNRYDGMGQDERGIWAAPGGARVAWFKDPDGNTLSLGQHSALVMPDRWASVQDAHELALAMPYVSVLCGPKENPIYQVGASRSSSSGRPSRR